MAGDWNVRSSPNVSACCAEATTVMVDLVLAGVLGYLLGAIPTGVLVSRLLHAPDVRQQGSGHTGGLNVSRTIGLWAGVATGLADAFLGLAAVSGAALLTDNPWAVTAAGLMAVAGHNWSVFIGFGGGVGLSTLVGALFRFSPLHTMGGLTILALLWLILVRLVRVHRARATILTMAVIGPLLWAFGLPWSSILLGAIGGLMAILKTLPDWSRQYD
jgi:glycerol-3-phosphate acyltransferase PlsY